MKIRCCRCEVSELADPALYERALSQLEWPERREKLEKFRFDKDKRLCLGAGLLAARMLKEAGAVSLDISRSQSGKPGLARDCGIHFNISHDGELAVCAVADVPVGVDVQRIPEYDPGLARSVLHPRELAWAEASPGRAAAFTRIWTRKESFLKLRGSGITGDLKALCVLPGEEPADAYFSELALGGYLICVCCGAPRETEFSALTLFG